MQILEDNLAEIEILQSVLYTTIHEERLRKNKQINK